MRKFFTAYFMWRQAAATVPSPIVENSIIKKNKDFKIAKKVLTPLYE